MNDNFTEAVNFALAHEGGFVDDKTDRGGTTNWGISLRFLRDIVGGDIDMDGDVDADDIRALTRQQAIDLYREHFWDKYQCAQLPRLIAIKFFDFCVNMGPAQATRLLQESLVCCQYRVAVDGIMGEQTLSATNMNHNNPEAIVAVLRARALGFYRELMAKRPALNKYRTGWERRALA